MELVIVASILVPIFTVGILWCLKIEKKEWNEGICPHCNEGHWKKFVDEDGLVRGDKFECDTCEAEFSTCGWRSYKPIKKEKES